jgi:glyoxylase-like metal-dependent hydrolase (beta-lactamase superfamily II)
MGDVEQLSQEAWLVRGGSNVGLLVRGSEALAIDTGLDRQAGRDIVRAAEGLGARISGVVITHAHADHCGGAAEIARRSGARVYASSLEAAVVRNPLLEPLYLYGGANPLPEFLHKFTLAAPCGVDEILKPGPWSVAGFDLEILPLPGHAPEQVGVLVGDVLFAADAFFPADTLQKHGIPFYADIDQAVESLESLRGRACARYASGHGPALDDAGPTLDANRVRLEQIREACLGALRQPADPPTVLAHVAARLGVSLEGPVAYYLANTTVLAALCSCHRAGQARPSVDGNRLLWSRT